MRRVLIVLERPSGAEEWWREACRNHGLCASIAYSGHIPPDSRPDMLLLRCYDLAAAREMEARGVRVLNAPDAMELCRDKYRTFMALRRAGVPTPDTVMLPGDTSSLGIPFIVKPNVGSKGEGVRLWQPGEAPPPDGYIAQRFVAESRGRDIRVWVVAGKAVAAVVRSNPGCVASNYARGGSATPFDSPDRERVYRLAEEAARVCGLFLAGVDILFGPDGT